MAIVPVIMGKGQACAQRALLTHNANAAKEVVFPFVHVHGTTKPTCTTIFLTLHFAMITLALFSQGMLPSSNRYWPDALSQNTTHTTAGHDFVHDHVGLSHRVLDSQ